MRKSEGQFLKDFQKGKEWELKVAALVRQRHPNLIDPTRTLVMDGIEWRGKWDDGDMKVSVPIQCKRRELDFTGREDFPFGTVIVDQENKLRSEAISERDYYALGIKDRLQWIRPFYAYWIGSRDMNTVGMILPATKPYWRLERQRDSKSDGAMIWNWCCPKEKVIFRRFSDALELWRWM